MNTSIKRCRLEVFTVLSLGIAFGFVVIGDGVYFPTHKCVSSRAASQILIEHSVISPSSMEKDSAAVPVIAGLCVGIALVISFSLLLGPTASSFPSPRSLERADIIMERTVCFGTCPDYSLTV